MIKKPTIAIVAISVGLFTSSAIFAGSTPPTDPNATTSADPTSAAQPADPSTDNKNLKNSLKNIEDKLKAAKDGKNAAGTGAGTPPTTTIAPTTEPTPTTSGTGTPSNQ